MPGSGIVLLNARVLTMDEARPTAEVVVTSGERIIYVGHRRGLDEGIVDGKKLIDLGGRTVVPGFIDSHVHLVEMARSRLGLDLGWCSSVGEVLDAVKQEVGRKPRGEWVVGYNWDESKWREGRPVTIEELDGVSPHHPVVLKRICQHLALVNSRALELARLPRDTEGLQLDPQTGSPNGIVQQEARRMVEACLRFSPQGLYPAIEAVQKELLSLGITTVHDMGSDFKLLREMFSEGRLSVRTVVYVGGHELSDIDEVSMGADGGRFKVCGAKFFIDGSIGARSAALSEPYADGEGGRGCLRWDIGELKDVVLHLHRRDRQVALHAIGDRAVGVALDVLEYAQRHSCGKDLRHRIEHCELLPEGAAERIKGLGVVVSAQPNFVSMWGGPGGMYERRLGRRRWAGMNPLGRLYDSSVPMAFGSDGMPVGPLYGIWSALNHPIAEGRMRPLDALRAYTLGGAFAAFEEPVKGTLTPGKLADMVVLSSDPAAARPEEIKGIRVEMTILGGRILFDSIYHGLASCSRNTTHLSK